MQLSVQAHGRIRLETFKKSSNSEISVVGRKETPNFHKTDAREKHKQTKPHNLKHGGVCECCRKMGYRILKTVPFMSFPHFLMLCWNVVKMEQRIGRDSYHSL